MIIRLTQEKAGKIVHDCRKILVRPEITIRDLSQIIGKFVASEPGVEYAVLKYRTLELEKDKSLKIPNVISSPK